MQGTGSPTQIKLDVPKTPSRARKYFGLAEPLEVTPEEAYRIRTLTGLDREEFAAVLGVSRRAIVNWEQGVNAVSDSAAIIFGVIRNKITEAVGSATQGPENPLAAYTTQELLEEVASRTAPTAPAESLPPLPPTPPKPVGRGRPRTRPVDDTPPRPVGRPKKVS